MDVPGLVDKVDSSEAGRKAVLGREYREKESTSVSDTRLGDSRVAVQVTQPALLAEALTSRKERTWMINSSPAYLSLLSSRVLYPPFNQQPRNGA